MYARVVQFCMYRVSNHGSKHTQLYVGGAETLEAICKTTRSLCLSSSILLLSAEREREREREREVLCARKYVVNKSRSVAGKCYSEGNIKFSH